MITHFETQWGNPASYSQAVTDGNLIFVCGELGVAAGEAPVPFEEQARTALTRLVACVREAGGDVDTILKINGYLADMSDFRVYDSIYLKKRFGRSKTRAHDRAGRRLRGADPRRGRRDRLEKEELTWGPAT